MNPAPAGLLEVLMARAASWLEVRIAVAALRRGDRGPLNMSLVTGWIQTQAPLRTRIRNMPAHELSRALTENRIILELISETPAEGCGPSRRRHRAA